MPVVSKRGVTRFTAFQLANKFMERLVAAFVLFDQQPLALAAGSNCAASTTTEIAVSIPNCALLDTFYVQANFAMPAGLSISHAYVSAGSSGSTSPENPGGETAGTMKIRFVNTTGAIVDATGAYGYFQTSAKAGLV